MRRRASWALLGGFALISGCQPGMAPLRSASGYVPEAPATVPIATVVNELKCDYLDFAYSDYARAKRLAISKVRGELRLHLSRDGTGSGELGVPVAAAPLRFAASGGSTDGGLVIPFELDPRVALNPAASGLDCKGAARLPQPILPFTQLAAAISEIPQGAGMRLAPLSWRGGFYLSQDGAGALAVVPVASESAGLGQDAMFVQRFDLAIETGVASWFGEDAPAPPPVRETRRPALARAPVTPPPSAAPTPPPTELAMNTTPRGFRIPTAPRPGVVRRASAGRCLADRTGELVCY